MAALPLLEQVRDLCADNEKRRLSVSKDHAATSFSSSSTNNNNNNKNLHPNVNLIKDHFTIRQAEAVTEASDSVLEALDGSEMAGLVELFVASRMALINHNNNNNNNNNQNNNNNNNNNPQIISQRAIDSFDVTAAKLRDYHRQYPQQPFDLPQLERPNEQDILNIRSNLFTGPERKGKAVDLTKSHKLFCDFQTQSCLAMAASQQQNNNNNQNQNNSSHVVTIVDHEVTYVEFLLDPIRAIGSAVSGKRKIEFARLYVPCLQAAALSLEGYATKTRPLTAAAEIKEARDKVSALMKNVSQNILQQNTNNSNKSFSQIISDEKFSERVKEVWKKFNMERNMPQDQNNNNIHKLALVKILQLEEHISVLCSTVVGDQLLMSSSDHIARSALRSTDEEAQDEDDDELKFQQDFFFSFYNHTPLSDRLGYTLSQSGRAVAANMRRLKKIQSQILEEDAAAAAAAARTGGGGQGGENDDGNNNGQDSAGGANGDGNDGDGQDGGDGMTNEERARLANPKNFPLDAEGKPIPVWLYKLHQLDKKFFCEICGQAYPGEYIFTQHFDEPVHELGLARIGIIINPLNAPHFRLVSTREGALATQRRLLEGEENARRRLRGDDDEEEDVTGNVATRAQLNLIKQQQQQQFARGY
jgi:hypothetical protein